MKVVTISSDGVNPSVYNVPEGVALSIEVWGPDPEDCHTVNIEGPYEGEPPERSDDE